MLKQLSESELFEARAYILWDFLLTGSPRWPGELIGNESHNLQDRKEPTWGP